jgi:8-oxo-dGTP diphosphatase
MPPRPLQPDGRLHGVIVAITRDDGRLLCIRRSLHVHPAPGKICFPGGGIEIGESQPDAVVREMKEELGIDVEPVRQCWRWESPDSPLVLWGWIAQWIAGELRPDPAEVGDVLWLMPDEAGNHTEGLPTNRDFVNCLAHEAASGRLRLNG